MSAATPAIDSPQQSRRTFLIAVVGNPNCGKTTLFNALTGLRQKVGNYPGVTVEKREGIVTADTALRLLDLPGTYSLSARSLDEQIARDVLLGRGPATPRPDAVLVVLDATNLERNLYLASQVIELGLPTVVACNVMDLLREAGHQLDVQKLSALLGVPVVPTVAHRKEGLDALRTALRQACAGAQRPSVVPAPPSAAEPQAPPPRRRQWSLSEPIEREVAALTPVLTSSGFADVAAADGAALLLLSEGQHAEGNHLPKPVREALDSSFRRLAADRDIDPGLELASARYTWLGGLVDACLQRAEQSAESVTDRLDRVLTHRLWGMLAFTGMMALLFYSIFIMAEPLMGAIETSVEAAQEAVSAVLPAGALQDLLNQGIIAGVGNVVVFFPQICILFLFIALLEDSGYMARAAFLMDRIMSRVGLHGKSFIPLLSSHACAIPGIMSTRTIESPRDRLTTILVAPLMSCSARLPVYTLLIAAILPGGAWTKAGVMLSMYALGIAAALTMATVFKKTLLRGPTPAFIMELPPYRVPRPFAVFRVMWDRSRLFLTRAGTVILAITIVLWALMSYPRSDERVAAFESQREALMAGAVSPEDVQARLDALNQREAAENLHNSFGGRMGRLIEPVIQPLGYDWRIGIGVVASFAAREVFVGTMGVVYSVGQADEESASLREQIAAAAWPDGRRVFTPLVAVGLMVFYVLACQCISTIAVVRRETNSWRWPLFMFGYMSVLAYTAALLVYQIGSALGIGTG